MSQPRRVSDESVASSIAGELSKPKLSFDVDLLTGFDHVCKYTDDGLKQLKDIASLFKKRQALEAEYAKGLAKLTASFKAVSPSSGSEAAVQGSVTAAWKNVLQELHDTATSHEKFATSLGLQVADPLYVGHKDLEAKRKQLVNEGQRRNRTLQDAYSALKKAQANYQQCQKEADELSEASEKAKHNLLSKDSTVSKLEGKLAGANDKAAVALRQLHEQEDYCDNVQSDHFAKHMPAILSSMETTEVLRCSKLMTCLAFSAQIATEMAEQNVTRGQKTLQMLDETKVRRDLEDFISHVEDIDLPVTSILQPTLKGHLDTRFLDSSKFKDHVFVLVAEQRRLYHYESENSMHPIRVLTLPYHTRIVRPVDDSLFSRQHCFQLALPGVTYFLAGPDADTSDAWKEALVSVCSPRRAKPATTSHVMRSVTVRVVEAKGFSKSGDYYCLVLLGDREYQARTTTKTGTTTPFWAQSFFLDEIPDGIDHITVQVCRASSSLLRGMIPPSAKQQASVLKRKMHLRTQGKKTDTLRKMKSIDEPEPEPAPPKVKQDVLGTVKLALTAKAGKEAWHEIKPDLPDESEPSCGTLRMGIVYTDEFVRPLAEYEPLEQILMKCDQTIVGTLDSAVAPADRVPFVETLCKLASAHDQLLDVLLCLCDAEIQATADPRTLFRGNSLASKALDQFMKYKTITETKYMTHTLGALVDSVFDLKASCEVDPTRLETSDPAKELAQNMRRLMAQTALAWNSVMHSLDNLPDDLKYVFAHLEKLVVKKFPAPEVRQSAIAGFFFLRLICPAILGPQLFGLCTVIPVDQTARTLTLISKTLQNLANGVTYGAKENYMLPMNDFLQERKVEMTRCLKRVCSPKCQTKPSSSMGPVNRARALAAAQRLLEKNLSSLQTASEGCSPVGELVSVVTALRRPTEAGESAKSKPSGTPEAVPTEAAPTEAAAASGDAPPSDMPTPDAPRRRRKSPNAAAQASASSSPASSTQTSPKPRRKAPSPRPQSMALTGSARLEVDGYRTRTSSDSVLRRPKAAASRLSPEEFAARRTSDIPEFLFSDPPPPSGSARSSMFEPLPSSSKNAAELRATAMAMLEGDSDSDPSEV